MQTTFIMSSSNKNNLEFLVDPRLAVLCALSHLLLLLPAVSAAEPNARDAPAFVRKPSFIGSSGVRQQLPSTASAYPIARVAATADGTPLETPPVFALDTNSSGKSMKLDDAKADKKVLQGYVRVVPAGTNVPIIMDSAIDSDTSQDGDEFAARTSEDLSVDGSIVVPAGSVISGRITQLISPKTLNRSGSVALKFDTVTTPDNRQLPLVANLVTRSGVIHARRGLKDIAMDTGVVAAPMVIGGLIGILAGNSNTTSKPGAISNTKISKSSAAMIGLGVGVAIGVAVLLAKKGKKVDVRPGDELKIELAEELRMPMM